MVHILGSKIENFQSVGAGIYCSQLNISQKIGINSRTSIFAAECCAMNRTLDLTMSHTRGNFLIASDFLSVIKSLQKPVFHYNKNIHLVEIKTKYATFVSNSNNQNFVTFIWISAHIGISGNERADSLAKEAAGEMPSPDNKVPLTDLLCGFKIQAMYSLLELLIIILKSKVFLKVSTFFVIFTKIGVSRGLLGASPVPNGSDHYNLNASLARVNFVFNNECRCEAEFENLDHVIWQCPDYEDERKLLRRLPLRRKFRFPLSILSFLFGPDISDLRIIFNFLKQCSLRI
nr:PREDICTED: uncharacterized protein LOC105663206 isoform X1 [Megachile rotundata]